MKANTTAGMKNTWNAKNRLSVAPADGVAREDEPGDVRPEHGHASGLRRADDDRPDRRLIPPQQLPRERERESQQEQHRAREPVELAGELVRRHQVRAGHVDPDEQHHRGGAEVVHPAEEPAEQGLLGDELEAVVRLAARGYVGGGERDPGGDLQHEGEQRGAAEDVPPAGPRRNRVLERPAGRGDQAAAIVEPGEQARRSTRGSDDRDGTGEDLDLPVPHPHGVLRQRLRGGGPAETVPSA